MFGTGTEPVVYLSVNAFIAGMFAVGLATGVVLAVGGLFVIQVGHSHVTGQSSTTCNRAGRVWLCGIYLI